MEAMEYGFYCNPEDEKVLVKNLNKFLKSLDYRKMYKWEPSGLTDPEHPENEPNYSHYYCQFLKQHPGWYFDIYPNKDLDGKEKFPEHPEAGWTLFVNKTNPQNNSPGDDKKLNDFFSSLASATGFRTELLYTYSEKENRR
ncbi:hypothetical protein ACFL20_02285 [Spirochaetota bacterium]